MQSWFCGILDWLILGIAMEAEPEPSEADMR